jgi:DNA (cytosine-5)-methyltransferase 1
MKNKINVIELFAGVGGLSYGFSKNPSFEIIAANEIDKDIATAYSMNHPKTKMLNKDICDITIDDFMDISINKIDLIIGGPPCQSYSTLGKRKMDERANLFKQYKRLLHILEPQAFIFENVVGILSMDKGRLFERIQEEFKELGYKLQYQVLNAVEFGVPQVRERVILVGIKNNTKHYNFPRPTHGEGKIPFVTLEDALSDLPILKSGESSSEYVKLPDNDFLKFVRTTSILSEHKAPKNGAHLIKIMETLQDGQSKNDLPEEIRPKSGYGNTYAKLWWKRPSTTITRNFACPSSSRCVHPRDSRAMSIREGARLQSFPDHYIFYGSASTKRLEIGNAVPPLLSIHIANQAQKMFE